MNVIQFIASPFFFVIRENEKLNAFFDFLIFLVNRPDLADEAVSALRATVDFTQTSRKLRKVEVGQKVDDTLVEEFVVSDITNLLLQIKGWYFSKNTC